MKPANRGKNSSQPWSKLTILSTIIVLASTTGVPQVSRADEPFPAAMAGYPTGTITAIHETTFEINGRTVSLVPEAVIVDRHGDPVALTVIRVNTDVRYRIQKGTTDKIDWMLVILPE
ncbi:MAG: DUF2945 domain-containing protein [Nitrospira sp.]|nr:DUF2945 domain-containing protein [Nitrospira sp.]MDH4370944.1 DUF2945 domain-containing protein [Nitrospira sp.]MDH5346796.1 DUF2945 domain-containing protein [Nitrospira sp.]MDH5496296.1 DUF2945 domain-containing protein [Nitrospira sp.]MDH5724701.1 DUF2945 domain-containing protein [Nitrospira sp.]